MKSPSILYSIRLLLFSLSLGRSGDGLLIEHQNNLIGRIDAHLIESGSITVPVLFDTVLMYLEKQSHLILSRHFHLEFNGMKITRHTPDLKMLWNLQSQFEHRLKVLCPADILFDRRPYFSTSLRPSYFHDKEITSFTASNEFEMEFDFRIRPVDGVVSPNRNKVPLLFLESASMKLTAWLDPHMLEIMHFNSYPGLRGNSCWKSILSMNLYNDTYSSTTSFHHFYIQIGNGSLTDIVRVNLNGQTAIQRSDRQIFEKGETIHVLLFKAAYTVNGVINNVALYHS